MRMTAAERQIIYRFAGGETKLREEAIKIHRDLLRANGLERGNPYFDFMSEVDTPMPDLTLRVIYRKKVLALRGEER